jgi:hypothetical protein
MKMTKEVQRQLLNNVDSILYELDLYLDNSISEVDSLVLLERGELCINQFVQFFPEYENGFIPEINPNKKINLLSELITLKSKLSIIYNAINKLDVMSHAETDIIIQAGRYFYPNVVNLESYINKAVFPEYHYELNYKTAFAIIQILSEHGLVHKEGFFTIDCYGLFPGFKLTDRGLRASKDQSFLRKVCTEDDEILVSDISKQSDELIQLIEVKVDHYAKEDLLLTIEEISNCLNNRCFISSIALCGKVLELSMSMLITAKGINVNGTTLESKINSLRGIVTIENIILDMAHTIRRARNGRIHSSDSGVPKPSKEEAFSLFYAMVNVVKKIVFELGAASQ